MLDETTILSICSDYDLTQPQEFEAVRDVLRSIAKDVVAEEATGFNPSGLGANEVVDIIESNPGEARDAGEVRNISDSDLKSNDGRTTTTESSQAPSVTGTTSSKTSTHDAPDTFRLDVFDSLGEGEKQVQLLEMFTSLKPVDIKLALQKSKGDASLAIDALLNIELLEQTGQRLKGIDGFYTPDDMVPTKKRRGRKKKAAVRTTESTNSTPTTPVDDTSVIEEANRRKCFILIQHSQVMETPRLTCQENVAYLTERLNLTEPEIESIYNQQGSMGATIVKILDNYIAFGIDQDQIPEAQEQANKYPWIPPEYMNPIFEMTSPTYQFALDIIRVLADYFEKPAYLKYAVSYNIAAGSADDEASFREGGSNTGKAMPLSPRSTVPNGKAIWSHPTNLQSAVVQTTNIAASRDHSLTSVASSFRKGQSNPLFRQAAGFYAERAREQTRSHRQANAIEAGYLVDYSSTANQIDLHGVTVQDGVGIALDRVWRWWSGLGEYRAQEAREGFTVITGLGRHNADGKSRLRSNVFKALVADGWKVEVQTGKYLVTGRRR